jgi:beta-glucosidase
MENKIKELISKMTIEEKASLCSGETYWTTKPVERLGIPSIMVSDGPHGLRKQGGQADNLGIYDSIPATCFPTACALASSWNVELLGKVGKAIGEECQAENVHILLGPGVNIKRSPLCGRNFEYFSEDPMLSGELGAAFVNGVQSQGIGTSLKHFTANNQEYERMTISSEIDERVLREIYLAGFERVIKKAQPWTVMCSYNRLNGIYCSENKYLLTDILRDEWGFKGFVVSDWGAVNIRVEALKAGLDLEMPTTNGLSDRDIVKAVNEGKLDEEVLDKAVENILKILFKAVENQKENAVYDKEEHNKLAREAAAECIVLLKNEDKILPLNKDKLNKIAVIGAFAKEPRYQGGGSSHVNATKLENAYDEIVKMVGDSVEINYAEGYPLEKDDIDEEMLIHAKEAAKLAEVAILFIGLPERYESEGFDREHMEIPKNHKKLIEEVCSVQKNVVVVLSNGAAVTMAPWHNKVKGILEGWLTGQASGGAVSDILFGKVSPSAKLTETFPIKLSDNPSYLNFPGKKGKVKYQEGIFVGYRYYDAKEMEVLYPFGYGLSYTNFEYTDLKLSKKELLDTDTLEVKVKVKNIGDCFGQEIVQLYVKDIECREIRPEKELKAFTKVALNPGEEKEVILTLEKRDFAYYEENVKEWVVESGEFEILVGKSSREIVLKDTVNLKASQEIKFKVDRYTTIGEVVAEPKGKEIIEKLILQFRQSDSIVSEATDDQNPEMMHAMMQFMPLYKIINFSNGAISEEMLQSLIDTINSSIFAD